MDAISGLTLRTGAAALAALACLTATAPLPSARADSGGEGSHAAGSAAGTRPLAGPGLHVPAGPAAEKLPEGLSARSWVVADARTGQVLAAKDAHRQLPPASTLKTLFAVTVLPKFPQDMLHTVGKEDLRGVGPGSSMVGIKPGRRYTVADLWRGVFISSGNDAVHALCAMNGSVETTVRQMQAKARMLGAYDTHVVSPDGYDAPGQVTSAYDLSLFARAGLANPYFARYAATAEAKFPTGRTADGRVMGSFSIQNTNRLLSGATGVKPYPGLVGVKNGYTSKAGNTLVTAARRDGRTLIVTVMDPNSVRPHAVYEESRSLLDWGFSVAGEAPSVGTLNAAADSRPRHGAPAADRGGADRGSAGPAGAPAAAPAAAPGSAAPGWLLPAVAALLVCAAAPLLWQRRVRQALGEAVRRPLRRSTGS